MEGCVLPAPPSEQIPLVLSHQTAPGVPTVVVPPSAAQGCAGDAARLHQGWGEGGGFSTFRLSSTSLPFCWENSLLWMQTSC